MSSDELISRFVSYRETAGTDPFAEVNYADYVKRVQQMANRKCQWTVPPELYKGAKAAVMAIRRLPTIEASEKDIRGAVSVIRAVGEHSHSLKSLVPWVVFLEMLSAWKIARGLYGGSPRAALDIYCEGEQKQHQRRFIQQFQDRVRRLRVAVESSDFESVIALIEEVEANLEIFPCALSGHWLMAATPNIGVYRECLKLLRQRVTMEIRGKIVVMAEVVRESPIKPVSAYNDQHAAFYLELGKKGIVDQNLIKEFCQLHDAVRVLTSPRKTVRMSKHARLSEFLPDFKYSKTFSQDYQEYWDALGSTLQDVALRLISDISDRYFLADDDLRRNEIIKFGSINQHRGGVDKEKEVNLSTLLENKFDRMVSYLIARRIILRLSDTKTERKHLALKLGFLAREDGDTIRGGKHFGTYLKVRCGLTMDECRNPYQPGSSVHRVLCEERWLMKFRGC